MAANPWLAIDTGTVPAVRAWELRQAWEEFLQDRQLLGVRPPIAESWERCDAAGVDPSQSSGATVVADATEVADRWASHPLCSAAPLIRNCLGAIADADGNLIVVSDANGVLLWVDGPPAVRVDAANGMNFIEGGDWAETAVGTNAIGTALTADHAVQVFAAEHFNESVQRWTCAAAPIHDPDTEELLGTVDLTGWVTTAHPHSLACAMATARAVEEHLRGEMHERDAHLRRRFEEWVLKGPNQALVTASGRVLTSEPWIETGRLLVPPGGGELTLPNGIQAIAEPLGHNEAFVLRAVSTERRPLRRPCLNVRVLGHSHEFSIDGRPIAVSPRHREILVLLLCSPHGLSAEELACELYGDVGHPGTVRVQVSRLRKLLGGWIETDPYRISMEVRFDVAQIRGLLDRGLTREAAERYHGPVLPHSDAPGIARIRRELDSWLRQAAITCDDEETLWAWLESDSGRDDLLGWQRLLRRLSFRDPRRNLAAAQVTTLRARLSS